MRTTFLRIQPSKTDFLLPITSLVDAFLFVLLVLIQGWADGLNGRSVLTDVQIPTGVVVGTDAPVPDVPRLEVARDRVLLNGAVVARHRDFQITADGVSRLRSALVTERRRDGRFAAESRIALLADERAPYATIERVSSVLAASGYVDVKLVVMGVRSPGGR
jgi:biopolymer transport protein ExbD